MLKIVFNDKVLEIKKLDFPIKKEYFTGCHHLIKCLNKAGIKKFKDLPEDLSELYKLDLIGEKTVEKFFNQIALYEETIEKKGGIIFKTTEDIPPALYSLPIETLWAQIAPMLSFFKDATIKRIGEIPANFKALTNVKQIGQIAIKKLFNELMRLKESYASKNLFVLKDRNIILPDTLSLSTPLSKIAPDLEKHGFKSLKDVPRDLRALEDQPDFQVFISKLEKYIAKHEQKVNTEEFINTFESLLKGKPAIGISEKYAKVIQYRFGDPKMLTLQEVGDKVGLSRERIRQIVNIVLMKVVRHHGSYVLSTAINRKLHKGEQEFLKALRRKGEFLP